MVSLTTADNALKTLYLGVVSEQLNTNINPLLAKIKQTTADVWGKEIVKLAPYGVNGGVGAGTEDGALPMAASNNYARFTSELKNLYGTIEITDKAMRASENNAGAFVNLLNAEMEGLVKAASFNFGRMLYGDGSGTLATISEPIQGESSTVTLTSVRNVIEGQVIDFYRGGTKIASASGARIIYVDRKNSKITVDKKISSADVDAGDFITVQGSYGNELTGLGAIFNTNKPLYGLDRSEHPWMTPYMDTEVKNIDDIYIQKAIDDLEETAGSTVDFIVCSAGVKRAYQHHLASFVRNIDVLNLAGGFKALSYNGIPLVSDRFVGEGTMYLLNTSEFALHQLCDWKWLEGEDGKVIKQKAGLPVYTATLVKYADLICNKPRGQARITGISEQIA